MTVHTVVMFALVLVLTMVSLHSATADPECMPKPGEKFVRGSECCKVPKDFVPSTMVEKVEKCKTKIPMAKAGGTPGKPPMGPPSKEMINHAACIGECVFTEEDLLTNDKELDRAAINKYYMSENAELGPVVKMAVQKCLKTYAEDIDNSMECKSGAEQFSMCVNREVLINCPRDMWAATPDCESLKTRATNIKCKNMPVMMRMPGRPPKPE